MIPGSAKQASDVVQPASLREIILNYQLVHALGTLIFIKKDMS